MLGIDTHFLGWVVDLICKCTYVPLSGPLLNRSAKETNKQTNKDAWNCVWKKTAIICWLRVRNQRSQRPGF